MATCKKLIFAIAFAAILMPGLSRAEDIYPARPIRLIVGFAAGSSGDVAARIVGNKLGQILGQPVIVENRPGASSMIATDYVARASKDGYTLLLATIAATINTTLMPNKGANFQTDLAPIVLIGSIPNILVVTPKLEVKNVQELIALAKAKPDELLYGASGIGSGPHMATQLFEQMAGIKMRGVLYPGSAQTVTRSHRRPHPGDVCAVVDGRRPDRSRHRKALGFDRGEAASIAPDLPTIAEAAFARLQHRRLVRPSRAGGDAGGGHREGLESEQRDAEGHRGLEATRRIQGLDARGGSPEEFGTFIKSETERWAQVIKSMPAADKDGK